MKLLITVIVVFLIIMYGYAYIRYKKKRRQPMDHVQEFHEKYKDHSVCVNTDANTYQPIDFMDKDEFVSDIQSEVREQTGTNSPQTVPKKKLQF